MRVQIFSLLSERDKRNIRLCCKQLKQEIDTLVGLNIKFSEPIRNIYRLEWIKNLRINEVIVDAKSMTTGELIVLLQNRICLQSVQILDPEDFDLVPAFTVLSALDKLRVLHLYHTCKNYLGFLPLSVYRFARLQKFHISVCPYDILLDSAHVFCNVRCPQLQDLGLLVSFESRKNINLHQNESLEYSQWLLDMIQIFPSIRVLSVQLLLDKFAAKPLNTSDYFIGK